MKKIKYFKFINLSKEKDYSNLKEAKLSSGAETSLGGD